MILDIFLNTLMIAGIICTIIGILTVYHWFKTPKSPADDSNRINNITSWWLGLTRPEIIAKSYKYFRQDVKKNIDDVESTQRLDE